eukprot:scaffold35533_cov161-Skeletonema_dohrnii-CCMP3373.AAC.4
MVALGQKRERLLLPGPTRVSVSVLVILHEMRIGVPEYPYPCIMTHVHVASQPGQIFDWSIQSSEPIDIEANLAVNEARATADLPIGWM